MKKSVVIRIAYIPDSLRSSLSNQSKVTPGWCRSSFTDCPDGYYGANCTQQCHCGHGFCNVVTGLCKCYSGWQGQHCDAGTSCSYAFVLKIHNILPNPWSTKVALSHYILFLQISTAVHKRAVTEAFPAPMSQLQGRASDVVPVRLVRLGTVKFVVHWDDDDIPAGNASSLRDTNRERRLRTRAQ